VSTVDKEMTDLIYKVHPVPATLRDFVFDFGSLSADEELKYVHSMSTAALAQALEQVFPAALSEEYESECVRVNLLGGKYEISQLVPHWRAERIAEVCGVVARCIGSAQAWVREVERDPAVVSLRDVRRCLDLALWFLSNFSRTPKYSQLGPSVVLGLAFVYHYRLRSLADRTELWERVAVVLRATPARKLTGSGLEALRGASELQAVVKRLQLTLCRRLYIEEGVALNDALLENLFVVLVCMLNRLPVFLVGKPGTSKTLTLQVIASNLQGQRSRVAFWRRFPAVHIFPYQCSPMSDSLSIRHQFDMAVRYQSHAGSHALTVLLLDEVGLAEHSPSMPLKVLHAMLVDPPVSIVGVSNWVLDPAKMNRAICLQRPEPTFDDSVAAGLSMVAVNPRSRVRLQLWIPKLAAAFHRLYAEQEGREFFGMRDFYSLVCLLRDSLLGVRHTSLDPALLAYAVRRNFSGRPDVARLALLRFLQRCYTKQQRAQLPLPTTVDLIRDSLAQRGQARHLMLLTGNGAGLSLLFSAGLLRADRCSVLVGSEFPDDRNDVYLVKHVNEVKVAMRQGRTCVLVNHDTIYEALYDVLNQRYLVRTDSTTGKEVRMLRLAIGSRSQLCPVSDGFKVVVLAEAEHAYRTLDLPLLNRFEKQELAASDLLGPAHRRVATALTAWARGISAELGAARISDVFCAVYRETIPGAVLQESGFEDRACAAAEEHVLRRVKLALALLASPVAVHRCEEVRHLLAEQQLCGARSFQHALQQHARTALSGERAFTVFLTRSPVAHLALALHERPVRELALHTLHLAEVGSEEQLCAQLREFFSVADGATSGARLLLVQCDPLLCSQFAMQHAQHLCEEAARGGAGERHVAFLIHLPVSVGRRQRHFLLDCHPPWRYVYVDDLRPAASPAHEAAFLLEHSPRDLFADGHANLDQLLEAGLHSALSMTQRFREQPRLLTAPALSAEHYWPHAHSAPHAAGSYAARLRRARALLCVPEFRGVLCGTFYALLEQHASAADQKGLHLHVQLACGELCTGSFRQSCQEALSTLVTQALAVVVRAIDVHGNMALCDGATAAAESSGVGALWLRMLTHRALLDQEAVARLYRVGKRRHFGEALRRADSRLGEREFRAHFPFSHRLLRLLRAEDAGEGARAGARLRAAAVVLLGEVLVEEMACLSDAQPQLFLHDAVAQLLPQFAHLALLDQVLIARRVLADTWQASVTSALDGERGARTPAWHHPWEVVVALRRHRVLLFRLSALLGNEALDGEARAALLRCVCVRDQVAERSAGSVADLEASLLCALLAWLEQLVSPAQPCTWARLASVVDSLQVDLNALLAALRAAHCGALERLEERWSRLQVLRILALEVVAPLATELVTPCVAPASAADAHRLWSARAPALCAVHRLALSEDVTECGVALAELCGELSDVVAVCVGARLQALEQQIRQQEAAALEGRATALALTAHESVTPRKLFRAGGRYSLTRARSHAHEEQRRARAERQAQEVRLRERNTLRQQMHRQARTTVEAEARSESASAFESGGGLPEWFRRVAGWRPCWRQLDRLLRYHRELRGKLTAHAFHVSECCAGFLSRLLTTLVLQPQRARRVPLSAPQLAVCDALLHERAPPGIAQLFVDARVRHALALRLCECGTFPAPLDSHLLDVFLSARLVQLGEESVAERGAHLLVLAAEEEDMVLGTNDEHGDAGDAERRALRLREVEDRLLGAREARLAAELRGGVLPWRLQLSDAERALLCERLRAPLSLPLRNGELLARLQAEMARVCRLYHALGTTSSHSVHANLAGLLAAHRPARDHFLRQLLATGGVPLLIDLLQHGERHHHWLEAPLALIRELGVVEATPLAHLHLQGSADFAALLSALFDAVSRQRSSSDFYARLGAMQRELGEQRTVSTLLSLLVMRLHGDPARLEPAAAQRLMNMLTSHLPGELFAIARWVIEGRCAHFAIAARGTDGELSGVDRHLCATAVHVIASALAAEHGENLISRIFLRPHKAISWPGFRELDDESSAMGALGRVAWVRE
jgi:hypothetical protein